MLDNDLLSNVQNVIQPLMIEVRLHGWWRIQWILAMNDCFFTYYFSLQSPQSNRSHAGMFVSLHWACGIPLKDLQLCMAIYPLLQWSIGLVLFHDKTYPVVESRLLQLDLSITSRWINTVKCLSDQKGDQNTNCFVPFDQYVCFKCLAISRSFLGSLISPSAYCTWLVWTSRMAPWKGVPMEIPTRSTQAN